MKYEFDSQLFLLRNVNHSISMYYENFDVSKRTKKKQTNSF